MIFVYIFLTSLCMVVSRSIHISSNDTMSFLFTAGKYSIVHMYHIYFYPFLYIHGMWKNDIDELICKAETET